MKIKINDKDGKEIAMCEVAKDEMGNMLIYNEKGIKNIFHEYEQTEKEGFTDILEIDLE